MQENRFDQGATTPATVAAARPLAVQFTGSGSEYFRIWIVNLLFIMLTLGLYLPFAKARRLRYFCANTVVDGQALSFHGDAWKMFRGFVLLLLMMGAYGLAGRFSLTAGLIAFLLLCLVWPGLWRAALQFRLGNTGWRGLRFRFTGSRVGAYLAWLPVYLPALLVMLANAMSGSAPNAATVAPSTEWMLGLGMLGMVVLAPWSLALSKRYQHSGYALADQQAELGVGTARFYLLALKVAALGIVMIGLPAVLLGWIASQVFADNKAMLVTAITVGAGLGYLLGFLLLMPYGATLIQNLVWGNTSSDRVNFESRLRARALLLLTLKNFALMLLTLGLYRPFAVIATTRLRLQALSLQVEGDVDAWLAGTGAHYRDATGDAAGDFFGIDMGL